jgi:hypothetical protein
MAGSNVLSRCQFVASAGSVLIWAIVYAFVFCVIHRRESIGIRVKQTAKTNGAAYIQAVIIIDPSDEVQAAFLGGKAKGITSVQRFYPPKYVWFGLSGLKGNFTFIAAFPLPRTFSWQIGRSGDMEPIEHLFNRRPSYSQINDLEPTGHHRTFQYSIWYFSQITGCVVEVKSSDVDFRSLGLDKSFPRQVRLNLANPGLSFKFHALLQFKQAEENSPWGFEVRFEVKAEETV